ncbi:hypothetical protein JMA_25690 [Jeotgalibacillus malaysiensis]|uniref:Uncharacterized protein n=1 Tax=Jeotgalibacillus malaysiensis TaxID=1508404 RepID=A0A0B5AP44_9BACL|nr:hypothetical protein [Jeotgalibacillus malaysiensis]AJD91886.1 hypothetical protein JMA_25690 [Jeotgalibacillus malaysiensis]
MLRTEKEINDFLFAAGLNSESRAEVISKALLVPEEERLNVVISGADDAGVATDSDYFQHEEDEELWREIKKLKIGDRMAVLLPYFNPEAEKSEAAFETLQVNMETQIGYALTAGQLERMLKILTDEVKKRPPEALPDPKPAPESLEEQVRTRSSINKWFLAAAGLFVVVAGVLLFQNPGEQAGETTFAPVEDEGLLEEELELLNETVDREIELLSDELGLSIEAVWQLEFVSNVLSQVNSLQEMTEYAETTEEKTSTLSEIRRTGQLISTRLISPIGRLSDAASRVSATTSFGILEANDNLLSRFTYDAAGMIELYENALADYEDELTSLDTQLSDFTFSDEAQTLIDKINQNGFEVTVLPDRQTFDVNYGEDAINQVMNGLLTDEYLDIIQEQKAQPYVEDNETTYTYAQAADKLLQTESLLVRSAGTETLSSELLFHHTQLFQYFLRDITDESGQLRPEVKEVWQQMITFENQEDSTVARYVAQVYEGFDQNNFMISDEVTSVRDNYTIVPVSYRIRKAETYFPLNDTLRERYNMLNAFGDVQDISFFLPREAVQLYINSLILYNQEVAEMMSVPETFENADVGEWSGITLQANEITSIQTEYDNNQAIVTISGENFTERQIVMQQINGVWKAEFDPEHLTWF